MDGRWGWDVEEEKSKVAAARRRRRLRWTWNAREGVDAAVVMVMGEGKDDGGGFPLNERSNGLALDGMGRQINFSYT